MPRLFWKPRIIGLKYLRILEINDLIGSLYDGGVGGWLAILKYLREILKYIRIFGFFAPQAREKKYSRRGRPERAKEVVQKRPSLHQLMYIRNTSKASWTSLGT